MANQNQKKKDLLNAHQWLFPKLMQKIKVLNKGVFNPCNYLLHLDTE